MPYVTEQDLEDVLRSFKVDVRIVDEEYREKTFKGRGFCEEKVWICVLIKEKATLLLAV